MAWVPVTAVPWGPRFALFATDSNGAVRTAAGDPQSGLLPIGLTPNDPRGSVRICPISRRRAMTPHRRASYKRLQLPGRLHVPI